MTNNFAFITGASGLLGNRANILLRNKGFTTIGLAHNSIPLTDIVIHDIAELASITHQVAIILNLAGAPIANGRWTLARKEILETSRIKFTASLVKTLVKYNIRCDHFISGSAIGYYGTGKEQFDETSPKGSDFSAHLCQRWEDEAKQSRHVTPVTTILRTGLVLADKQGFMKPLQITTKLGVGTVFGSGKQIHSWIDIRDWVSALSFIIDKKIAGPVNLTAPNPVDHATFMATLAKTLRKTVLLKLPAIILKPMGEMKTLLLDGQSVLPKRLEHYHFKFQFPDLEGALASLD